MAKLTPKRLRFCQEYPLDLNGTQAAIRAGYSAKTAASIAEALLRNIEIQQKIAEIQAERAERVKVDADRVVSELAAIAFCDITEAFRSEEGKLVLKDPATLPDSVRRAIASIAPVQIKGEIYYKISLHNKLAALESLGKYLGMFGEFNGAIATLRTYGINLKQLPDGWVVDGGDRP